MTIQFSFHITLIIIQHNFTFINAITMRAVMHNVRSSIVFCMMSSLLSANELLSRFGYQTGCHNIFDFATWCRFIFIVRTVFFQFIAITTFTLYKARYTIVNISFRNKSLINEHINIIQWTKNV